MHIEDNSIVTIHYTLTKPNGDMIESSRDGEPLEYTHATDALVPGLEQALKGKKAGDRVTVSVQPEQGYGERSEQLLQQVPRDIFQFDGAIEPGMRFQADTGHGIELVTVIGADETSVTVDANHPLAGEVLNFDVDIIAVRAPAEAEA